jgi:hypothetical protein
MIRPRLRDLGSSVGNLPTGAHNAITDVDGVRVGHTTLISGEGRLVPGQGPVRTGVTVILSHGDNLFCPHASSAAIFCVKAAASMARYASQTIVPVRYVSRHVALAAWQHPTLGNPSGWSGAGLAACAEDRVSGWQSTCPNSWSGSASSCQP